MDIILRILTIIGSIGLFLFGMKLLSESLQKVAGAGIRRKMAAITHSNSSRVALGMAVTGIVQSSSAVTVMIVSFVNAGIVTLRQAIGMIFGANIGTTITAWLICLFGFQVSISSIAVPLAGIGFALILTKNENTRSIGSIVMGFALMFIALDVIRTAFEVILESSELSELLREYSSQGYISILLMILVGTLLTAIIQSSSATITLTLVLVQSGWMPVEAGAAMILGENIGTTVTANIAALLANTNAKRAAIAHTIINVIGVIWLAPFLGYIMPVLDDFIAVPFSLAMFHTLFNVTNTMLLINFVPQIVKLTSRFFPSKSNDTKKHLQILGTPLLSTAEISIVQSGNEIANHARRTLKMFGFVRSMMTENDPQEFENLYKRVEKYEEITQRVESELIVYLSELAKADLSRKMVLELQNMLRITLHLEWLAKNNLTIAQILKRKRDKSLWFDVKQRDNVCMMMDYVEQALYLMSANLDAPSPDKLRKSKDTQSDIHDFYVTLRDNKDGIDISRHDSVIVYFELLRECEKLSESAFSIVNIIDKLKIKSQKL